jgi:hypothetical protein
MLYLSSNQILIQGGSDRLNRSIGDTWLLKINTINKHIEARLIIKQESDDELFTESLTDRIGGSLVMLYNQSEPALVGGVFHSSLHLHQ